MSFFNNFLFWTVDLFKILYFYAIFVLKTCLFAITDKNSNKKETLFYWRMTLFNIKIINRIEMWFKDWQIILKCCLMFIWKKEAWNYFPDFIIEQKK